MRKVYLSGPMTGIPDFNFPKFHRLAAVIRATGVECFNPAETDGGSQDKPYEFYIREDIKALLECTELALMPGWENSKGANLELSIARALKLPVYQLTEDGIIDTSVNIAA